jgi:hypothetical protein
MVYDLRLVYTPGLFRAFIGSTVIASVNEDLYTRFGGWAYLGLTSFFKGNSRTVGISSSYICEVDYVSTFYYKWLVGSQFVENSGINIPAGSGAQLTLKYKDAAGNVIPHFSGEGLFDNKIELIDTTGGAELTSLTASTDGFSLTTTVKPSPTAGGPFGLQIKTDNGIFEIEYNISPSEFDYVTIEQPGLVKQDGEFFLSPSEYMWDDIAMAKSISVIVTTHDTYGNYKNL